MDEEEILDAIIVIIRKYYIPDHHFDLLPESVWKGQARHLLRQYMKQRVQVGPIDDEEKQQVASRVCEFIIADLIHKANAGAESKNIERDGAELFYRRALNHMARESFADAERALTQAVQIDDSFVAAWEALLEVLNHNGKEELAKQVKSKLRTLT